MADTAPASSATNTDPSVRTRILSLLKENGAEGWQLCYESDLAAWDRGQVAPALAKLLETNSLPDGLAVVPGCGYGYDIAALASSTRKVIGVDIAPAAVEQAAKTVAGIQNAETKLADFFKLDLDGAVDLLYDYTFLCALPPTMRDAWADKVSKLLKPGAVLVTLMFPLNITTTEGPPYALSPQTYKDLLLTRGFELTQFDETIDSFPDRKGKEALGVWKRV